MEAHEFSFLQWLANLLGPGGFVAALAATAEAWFIFKLYHWHHNERLETRKECEIEREGWNATIDAMNVEKASRFKDYRKDIKEQFAIVNGFKDTMESFASLLRRGEKRAPARAPARPATGRKRGR